MKIEKFPYVHFDKNVKTVKKSKNLDLSKQKFF